LAIQEKTLGPDHPMVTTNLEGLAALYRKTGRTEEAAALEQRAAVIRAKYDPKAWRDKMRTAASPMERE
jgi:hypothetical protein